MLPVLLVALGGALGAVARFLVAEFFLRRVGAGFPWGTLFINVTGCVVIALFFAISGTQALNPNYRYLIPIGFVGAYTTFSTFSLETQRLLERGAFGAAAAYVLASNALGLLAIYGGLWLGRR